MHLIFTLVNIVSGSTHNLDLPIKVEDLPTYNENREYIFQQYEDVLESLPSPAMNAALLPENKGKCKYIGIYPGDHHRVVLERGEDDDGTDFINASYLQGYSEDNMYIAAQGPQQSTIDDFWEMIYQHRPRTIVMLTNLIELCRPKCERYWPEGSGKKMSFGDIQVELIKTDVWANYTIRTLRLTKKDVMFNIQQFHYTAWPDHGVPNETSPFVTFTRKVKEMTCRLDGPYLVHCSAGVGRTGTFIALDILLEEARQQRAVNVMEWVRRMRIRRPSMVQVKEQYYFLHCVLEEYLATESFVCEPTELERKLQINRDQPGPAEDLITAEYQRVEQKLSKAQNHNPVALQENNRDKNRFPDILPDASHSAYLDGGSYINAVYVDHYRAQRHFIATQLPLSNTITDFWKLIDAQEVKVIVQLEDEETGFYPAADNNVVEYDDITITRNRTEANDIMTIISLTVNFTKTTRPISVLLVNKWDTTNGLRPDFKSMVYYSQTLEKYQQLEDNKICVTDMNGSSRCGLFITAHNALERLKTEQQVDIYSTALMARLRRRQFLQTQEDYVYLYQVLNYFVSTFSDYSNFSS